MRFLFQPVCFGCKPLQDLGSLFNKQQGHKTQTFGYFETFLYFDKAFFETLRQESL